MSAAWFGDSVDSSINTFWPRRSRIHRTILSGGAITSASTDMSGALEAACLAMKYPDFLDGAEIDCGGSSAPAADTSYVLIIMSQGDFAGDDPSEIVEDLRAAGYKIVTVALRASPTGRATLRKLASSADLFFDIKHAKEVADALSSALTLRIVKGESAGG